MTFDELLESIAGEPFFDLATVVHLSGEARASVRSQLYRWVRAEKLIPLRRGTYTLADRYRKVPINPAQLANHIYRPSYLSTFWALGFYGLIPERAVTFTSVTTRVPRRFENAFGTFDYRNLKLGAFFGYRVAEIQREKVLLAEPEKALLDLWHLESGAWTASRMNEMRFQNWDVVEPSKLESYAATFKSPRLRRAARLWVELAAAEREGTVEL